jgi:hypothetical protein
MGTEAQLDFPSFSFFSVFFSHLNPYFEFESFCGLHLLSKTSNLNLYNIYIYIFTLNFIHLVISLLFFPISQFLNFPLEFKFHLGFFLTYFFLCYFYIATNNALTIKIPA